MTRSARAGEHVIRAPFRSVTTETGERLWIASGAWGTTNDQPHYVFAVAAAPDADAERSGWYVAGPTRYVAQIRQGRDPDEGLAARDGFRNLGAVIVGSTEAGPIMRLPFEAQAFDERVAEAIRETRAWVVEKQQRERAVREATSAQAARTHAAKVAKLRRGAKVRIVIESAIPGWEQFVDGIFEEWNEPVAIVRMTLPGRRRRGLYRVPPVNIGIP